ncbi:MAG: histidine phosphatase family protein [Acidimicrobiia bacterium]
MTKFVFVRHAPTTGDRGDAGLSVDGRELARRVAGELRARKATYVFTSPLHRAVETASEIAHGLGLEVRVDKRLRERVNWGDVEGETWEEFLFRWERADTEQSRARLAAFVDDISSQYPHATIIAVTHGGIVGDYLGGHEDWPHCGITEIEV